MGHIETAIRKKVPDVPEIWMILDSGLTPDILESKQL